MKVAIVSLLFMACVLTDIFSEVQGGQGSKKKCSNPTGHDGESQTEGCLKQTCKNGVWRPSLEHEVCCYNDEAFPPNTTIAASKDEDDCTEASIECRSDGNKARMVLNVDSTSCLTVEQQLEEVKQLLEEHMDTTDELACCCQMDSTLATIATTTTAPDTTTATTTTTTKGILMSGGRGAYTNVEVYVPSTGQSCSLPSLPDERISHTMDSLYICGGDFSTNCLHFSSGQWYTSHTLVEERYGHSSWQTDQGLVLMGGDGSRSTSEIAPTAGEQGGPSFAMQYNTSYACAMPDLVTDSVIITGGYHTMQVVSRYGMDGFIEDLPQLVVGRQGHGCGSYLRLDGTEVLMVAGGWDGVESKNYLSSTEVLTTDSPAWTMATPLTRAVSYVRIITIGNIVTLTGGYDGSAIRDEIIEWRDEEQEWVEIGKMKMARHSHAVTTIQLDDPAMEHCG